MAASVAYTTTIAADNSLLLVHIAAVAQNPTHHPETENPYFRIEILDTDGSVLSNCPSHTIRVPKDFAGRNDSGVTSLDDSKTYWKDWSTIGFNLADYAGQDVKVRITASRCVTGFHYSYCYFALGCGTMQIEISAETADSITYTAPVGFNYEWYLASDTSKTAISPATALPHSSHSCPTPCTP